MGDSMKLVTRWIGVMLWCFGGVSCRGLLSTYHVEGVRLGVVGQGGGVRSAMWAGWCGRSGRRRN